MSVEYKDYYRILGVGRGATDAEIKKAFRKLARKFHPDVATEKAMAEEKFKEINEAYEVLGDPEKRKRYDALGSSWHSEAVPPRDAGGAWAGGGMPEGFEFEGTGFSDFFERYFGAARPHGGMGGFGEFGGGGGVPRARRGQDIEGDLMVTLAESMTGSMRTISLRQPDPRTGRTEEEQVQVRIPAGIHEGQRLRVAGHGGRGSGGGEAGDLFLRVRLAADPDFRARGRDLYCDLSVAPWEAVLGVTVELGLPGGRTVQLKVPAGTAAGDQLRVRGYGLPSKKGAGDVYVVIRIEVPAKSSAEEKALWGRLREVSKFNPRES